MTTASARVDKYWESGQDRLASTPYFEVSFSAISELLRFQREEAVSDQGVMQHASQPGDRVPLVVDLPASLVAAYAEAAVRHALVTRLEDDSWFASVLALPGVWGAGASENEALHDLQVSIPDWVAVHRQQSIYIPEIEGFDLNL